MIKVHTFGGMTCTMAGEDEKKMVSAQRGDLTAISVSPLVVLPSEA